jgi:RNA polymerase sigma factor (sigma-70 family)
MMSVPTSTADWAGIYAQHGQSMRATGRAAMGGENDSIREVLGKTADEVVGDVIEELMTKGTDLSQVGNVRGYLNAAVRNRVRDLHRRSKFEAPVDLDFDIIVGAEDIEAEVDREELRQQAMTGLDQLPERERYALVERIMKCRPAQDVAAEIGVKPQQVSQLYNAALQKLRQLPAFTELLSFDRSPPSPSTATGPDATGTPS